METLSKKDKILFFTDWISGDFYKIGLDKKSNSWVAGKGSYGITVKIYSKYEKGTVVIQVFLNNWENEQYEKLGIKSGYVVGDFEVNLNGANNLDDIKKIAKIAAGKLGNICKLKRIDIKKLWPRNLKDEYFNVNLKLETIEKLLNMP